MSPLWKGLLLASYYVVTVQGNMIRQNAAEVFRGSSDPKNHYAVQERPPPTRASSNGGNATFHAFAAEPTTSTGALRCGAGTFCLDGSCCGPNNLCGFGKDYCGTGCQHNCTATAPCGRDSAGGNIACGMNLCCSYYGWCGVTAEYCTPPKKTGAEGCQTRYSDCQMHSPFQCDASAASATKRSIGYYQGGNVYSDDRKCNKVAPKDIQYANKYTHLYWAFAQIDDNSHEIKPSDSRDTSLYHDFTALSQNGNVKTWISVGGFDFTTDHPEAWTSMVSTAQTRQAFINSAQKFMATYGFQGIDLDWEYPVDEKRGGNINDMTNLVSLVREMRSKWGSQYGISLAIAPDLWYLQHYDAKGLLASADWIGFMSYDLHGPWDANVPRVGKVVYGQTDLYDIERDLIPLWYDLSPSDMQKVNFGLARYGRGYTLADSSCNKADGSCAWTAGNYPAQCTATEGIMSLTEIEDIIKKKSLTPTSLSSGHGDSLMKQITWDDQWIGYDDADTIKAKTNFASSRCFGGTMSWSVDLDSGSIPQEDDGDDGGQFDSPPNPPPVCNKEYQELASLQSDKSNPDECMNVYLVGVLRYILKSTLADYAKIISDNYDHKFGVFKYSIIQSLPAAFNAFVFKNPDNYFHCESEGRGNCCSDCRFGDCSTCDHSPDCSSTFGRRAKPCPTAFPDNDFGDGHQSDGREAGDWWWSFKDDNAKSAFWTDIAKANGISESWFNADQRVVGTSKGNGCTGHVTEDDCFYHWNGWFTAKSDIDLANPKDIIGKALDNYGDITTSLAEASINMQYSFQGFTSDTYVDAVSVPVLLAQASITAMRSVAETADKLEEEQRKATIVQIISAVLLFVPVVGEVADAVGLAVLARLISLGGDLGDSALGLYGIVDDPSSAVFALFGALRLKKDWEAAASFRRSLKKTDLDAMGKDVNAGLTKIDDMVKSCIY